MDILQDDEELQEPQNISGASSESGQQVCHNSSVFLCVGML